jgi:hypothetical protein
MSKIKFIQFNAVCNDFPLTDIRPECLKSLSSERSDCNEGFIKILSRQNQEIQPESGVLKDRLDWVRTRGAQPKTRK